MTAEMLEGRPVAREIRERARGELSRYSSAYSRLPTLAVVSVGDDSSALAYRDAIVKSGASIGLPVSVHALHGSVPQTELNELLDDLNTQADINGVLVLQPLPPHLSRIEVADRLDPLKDIDGITTFNAGRLFHDDRDVLAPSTPAGGMALLKHYQVAISGAHAVVVGRSPVVGRPMASMLLAENATVTTCHSRTRRLELFTRQADILVSAVGRPHSISAEMVKPGATVVDFGVNFVNGQMVGDVDMEAVRSVAGRLTPVPGGTGRVTTTILLRNTIKAATLQRTRNSSGIARLAAADGN